MFECIHLSSPFDPDSALDCASSGAGVQSDDGGIVFADWLEMATDLASWRRGAGVYRKPR